MEKKQLEQILIDLERYTAQLPPQLQEHMKHLRKVMGQYPDHQFMLATDGVVTVPAGHQPYHPDDPSMAANRLYDSLNDYIDHLRQEGADAGLVSILRRLRGLLDASERDFP